MCGTENRRHPQGTQATDLLYNCTDGFREQPFDRRGLNVDVISCSSGLPMGRKPRRRLDLNQGRRVNRRHTRSIDYEWSRMPRTLTSRPARDENVYPPGGPGKQMKTLGEAG